jgi:hypothetical protein
MKKSLTLSILALAVTALTASVAQAQAATGTASATVVGSLSIVQQTALNFGSFAPSATAGTIDSYGNTTGGVTGFGGATPAVFNATGSPTTNFTIVSDATVKLTSGANSMTATLTAPTVSVTDSTGNRAFNVTGSLPVAASQPSGSYTGTYNINVHY